MYDAQDNNVGCILERARDIDQPAAAQERSENFLLFTFSTSMLYLRSFVVNIKEIEAPDMV